MQLYKFVAAVLVIVFIQACGPGPKTPTARVQTPRSTAVEPTGTPTRTPTKRPTATQTRTPTRTPSPTPQSIGDVTNLQTDVRAGPANALEAVNGLRALLNNDGVQVTNGGIARLDFGNNIRVKLFNDSTLGGVSAEVLPGAPNLVRMKLARGGLSGQVVKSGGHLSVEIANGVTVNVLGTEFFVTYDPDTRVATVGNFNGTVEYGLPGQPNPTPLDPQMMVEIPPNGPAQVLPLVFDRATFDQNAQADNSPLGGLESLRDREGPKIGGLSTSNDWAYFDSGCVPGSQMLTITANVTDNTAVGPVTLVYWYSAAEVPDSPARNVPMERIDDTTFRVVINVGEDAGLTAPNGSTYYEAYTQGQLVFRVEAGDIFGNPGESGNASVNVAQNPIC